MTTSITKDGIVFPDATIQTTGASPYCRNRIINGKMMIDQRNNGAVVTFQTTGFPTGATNGYFVDRFSGRNTRTNGTTLTAQQVTDAPVGTGLNYSVEFINQTAGVAAGDLIWFRHIIEGTQIGDLKWGTAHAKTITLSFWVKSSIVGTFAVSVRNNPRTYTYIATYTINAADTWEYKTITIAGPTVGTWDITTNAGILITWDLGIGSTYEGTISDSWITDDFHSITGTTKLSNTAGASIKFTGVQFEIGTRATSFEHLPIAIELARCERYYSINSGNQRGYVLAAGVLECWLAWRSILRSATPTVIRVAGTMTNASASSGSAGVNAYGMRYAIIGVAAGITGEVGGIYKVEAEL